MFHINVTSIDPVFPPPHDQYCVPEYPNKQNKAVQLPVWNSRQCKQSAQEWNNVDIKAMFDPLSPRCLLDTAS